MIRLGVAWHHYLGRLQVAGAGGVDGPDPAVAG
jgi:hypothetical protein